MNNFEYQQVTDVTAAHHAINTTKNAAFIAGGTNLIDLWKYDLTHPELLVDINRLTGYKSIADKDDGGVRLGALMTNADTAYHH
jgi:xanthine dehydrogenase YagS FAD-binding subunit